MSSKTQNLSSLEINQTPMLRLDNILEAKLIEILDPLASNRAKEAAARKIINSVKGVLPRKYWQLGEDKKAQAVSSELRNTTIALEALDVVQDWAGDRLVNQKNHPESVEVEKKALRWINSRAINLDFVIGARAALLPAHGAAPS